jgi:hypothetical protein
MHHRSGQYPFCNQLVMPSYSTAKSIFTGGALMNLQERYGNGATTAPKDLIVSDYVSSCDAYSACSFENALDMVTGNYNSWHPYRDEESRAVDAFFLALSYDGKIDFSCNEWPEKVPPGERWIYHTSDHFLLGAAMNSFFKSKEGPSANLFDSLIVEDFFTPLGADTYIYINLLHIICSFLLIFMSCIVYVGMSATSKVTTTTYGTPAQPFTGFGLFFLRDDITKLLNFFSNDNGIINQTRVLDANMLDGALQKNPQDIGYTFSYAFVEYRYNNGFLGADLQEQLSCSEPIFVPFMEGKQYL